MNKGTPQYNSNKVAPKYSPSKSPTRSPSNNQGSPKNLNSSYGKNLSFNKSPSIVQPGNGTFQTLNDETKIDITQNNHTMINQTQDIILDHRDDLGITDIFEGEDIDPECIKAKRIKMEKSVVYRFDAVNGLSNEKMEQTVNYMHPRIKEQPSQANSQKRGYKRHKCCTTRTGWHCLFCKKCSNSDLTQYGEGVTLYFMLLKYLMCLFLALSVLSVPAYFFYWSGNASNISEYRNVKWALTSFTLGNIGQSEISCNSATLKEGRINLFCPYGTLDAITEFGQAYESSGNSCPSNNYDDNSMIFTPSACSINSGQYPDYSYQQLKTVFNENCQNKASCEMTFNSTMIPQVCRSYNNRGYDSYMMVFFMQATCRSDSISFPFMGGVSLSKNVVSLIVISCDIAIGFAIFFALIFLKMFQYKTKYEINKEFVSPNAFTVQLTNLPHPKNLLEIKSRLWCWVDSVLEKETKTYSVLKTGQIDEFQNSVANISFSFSNNIRMKYAEKIEVIILEKKKYQMIMQKNPKKTVHCKVQISKAEQKLLKYQQLIERESIKHPSKLTTAFVQFQSMNGKLKFMKAMNVQKCKQMCNKDKLKHKFFDGVWPQVSEVCVPAQINWENLEINRPSRCGRQLLMWVIGVLIVCISIVCLVIQKYYNNQNQAAYDVSDCGSASSTMQEAYEDYMLPSKEQQGLLGCYCYTQFSAITFDVRNIVFPNQEKLCLTWIANEIISTSLIYIIACALTLMNTIIKAVIHVLTRFQRIHNKTDEQSSNAFKMFVLQLINTILVILLVNIKIFYDKDLPYYTPFFNGSYNDFTVEWYRIVGSTITLTMLVNIITPHFFNLIAAIFKSCGRCFDRGCSMNRKQTKKMIQEEYEKLYLGSDFIMEMRYSQILSSIFICLIFSSGMPMLYPITVISFFLTYWIDKYLFLRVYRTPFEYDMTLADKVRIIMKFAVFVHFAFGFYMYSNSTIFSYEGENFSFIQDVSQYIESTTFYNHFSYLPVSRLTQVHSLIYLFGFGVYIILFIINEFIGGLGMKCYWKCICCLNAKKQQEIKAEMFSGDIFRELKVEDLQTEHIKTKHELEEFKGHMGKGDLTDNIITQLYEKKLENKLKHIKGILVEELRNMKDVSTFNGTQDAFKKRHDNIREDEKFRMKGLFSYEITHYENYKRSIRVERQMAKIINQLKQ